MSSYKISHFRDLSDAFKSIKPNVLLRSGHLSKLNTVKKNRFIDEYNITDIIDLRTSEELEDKPENFNKINYYNFPVLTNFENPLVNSKTRRKILNHIMIDEGGSINHLKNVYETLALSENARLYFKKFIEIILNAKGSVLWHCTQGKDRTGVASILLLFILGFDKDDIKKDYLNYNLKSKFKRLMIKTAMRIFTLSNKKAVELDNLLIAKGCYFDAYYDAVISKYSSFDNYFEKVFNLNKDDILKIREKYLY